MKLIGDKYMGYPKGRKMTPEQIERNKLAQSRPDVRKKKSEKVRRTMNSPEMHEKLSEASKKRWSKLEEHIKTSNSVKLAMARPDVYCRYKSALDTFWKNNGDSHKIRLKEIHNSPEVIKKRIGERNPNWKGGISFEPYCSKFNNQFKERVRAFFSYECLICGKSQEENEIKLSVHHVDYDKNACCDGSEQPIFASLCKRCHTKTNYDRERWAYIMHYIVDYFYGGKSYYTLEEMQSRYGDN